MHSDTMNSAGLQIRLLGQLTLFRDAVQLSLPASRKVRALFAFLSLNSGGVTRSNLCDLLWDVPNDPRGELRWCLSKIRSVLEQSDKHRIETSNDRIALNVSDCWLDTAEIEKALQLGIAQSTAEQLRTLCDLFRGDFLEGLQIDGNARFNGWLLAQRHRFRASHLAIVEALCEKLTLGSNEHFQYLQTWLQLAPFDRRPHEALMHTLAERGRVPDAEAHLVSAIRQFEAEGLDWLPLRESWRTLRLKHATPIPVSHLEIKSTDSAPEYSSANLAAENGAGIDAASKVHRRASVAVMPFVDQVIQTGERGGIADGLAEDIITRLSKLRVFFVIARGTAFALGDRKIDPHEAGRILNVDYVVSGSVRKQGQRIAVKVELVETHSARVQWADEFECALSDAVAELDRIGNRIVAAIAEEIEMAERNRAVLKPPNSLDAWEAYHRGLWHMYRFSDADNTQAEQFFRSAIQLDPTFARAHAGLSFTHFQNAFVLRVGDRSRQTELAYQTAGQSLLADDRDPAAHWAMGRALWLRRQQDESLRELSRSVELSPNFALGHYTVGFVHSQSGDPRTAIEAVDYSRSLSPFDPLQFAMLATTALAHVRLGNYEEGASWALKAAARPNAHTHILAIATHCLAVAGRLDEARTFAASIRKNLPRYSVDDFLTALHFDKDTVELFRGAAQRIGFS
jgi:DNA-binding SARP family transcriptional activator/TolB-like protein/Tfp pilus assembly protein PilF